MSDFDPRAQRSAFFEAGHAIGALLEGFTVERVFFSPEENEIWSEIVEPELPPEGSAWTDRDRANARSLIRALLSGPAAQEKYSFGSCSSELTLSDWDIAVEACVWRAIDLAGRFESGSAVLPLLWHEVGATLHRPGVWAAIAATADMLMQCGELAGSEVEQFAAHAMGAAPG